MIRKLFYTALAFGLLIVLAFVFTLPNLGTTSARNSKLPYRGQFYGTPIHGDSAGHTPKYEHQAAFRFRADKTGTVTAIRIHNRIITDRDRERLMQKTCLPRGYATIEECEKDLDLYSEGDGGRVLVEIQTDNPEEHVPSGNVLARATRAYTPRKEPSYLTLEFNQGAYLEAGKLYHIVYNQVGTTGLVVLNGSYTYQPLSPRGGPYYGNDYATLYRHGPEDDWNTKENVLPLFELRYDDGTAVGPAYFTVASGRNVKHVGGEEKVRQQFTVRGAPRVVDGVWIRLGHLAQGKGDVFLTLQDQKGRTLRHTTITEAQVGHTPDSSEQSAIQNHPVGWAYAPFSKPYTLDPDTTYYLEVTAPANARYYITAHLEMAGFGFESRDIWRDAVAQFTTDGGATWKNWSFTYGSDPSKERADLDLNLLFTIEGEPRRISVIDGIGVEPPS